jgi:hypothetical protein
VSTYPKYALEIIATDEGKWECKRGEPPKLASLIICVQFYLWDFQVPQCHFKEDHCLLWYLAAVQLFRSIKVKLFPGRRGVLWRDGGVCVVGEGVVGGSVEDTMEVRKRGVLPGRSVSGC